MSLFRTGKINN